jgi:hypothetical protein
MSSPLLIVTKQDKADKSSMASQAMETTTTRISSQVRKYKKNDGEYVVKDTHKRVEKRVYTAKKGDKSPQMTAKHPGHKKMTIYEDHEEDTNKVKQKSKNQR